MQMYIRSAKTYGFCMFACLVLMSALLSCLQKCMLSSDIKREYRQNMCRKKWHNVSYRYVSYIKLETSDT